MYRDDLEAALARNAILERRVAELEGARVPRPATPASTVTPTPSPVRRVTPTKQRGAITYASPATWLPLRKRLVHSLEHTWRSLLAKRPSWEVQNWSSSIVVVHLLARPAAWVGACIALLAMTVWFVLGLVWLVPSLAITFAGFMVGSVVLVPIIALASVRRSDGRSVPAGLQWGVQQPASGDPDELFLYSVMGMSFLHLPVTLWLLGG
jgi:hypothetical protein